MAKRFLRDFSDSDNHHAFVDLVGRGGGDGAADAAAAAAVLVSSYDTNPVGLWGCATTKRIPKASPEDP